MTEHRFLDVADVPAAIHLSNGNLALKNTGHTLATIPLIDIEAVTISNPQATISRAAMSSLAEAGVPMVVCDDRHMPVGMMLPLRHNAVQTERFAAQASASLPVKKRIWQQIVRAKITAQARLLTETMGSDRGLGDLVAQVRSGDPANVEATASRRYWQALFPDDGFRRRRYEFWPNPAFNYGYAILRAMVARATCASGLHPSLGVHHHNRYNPFCLADDLMEPYRPLVDRVIVTTMLQDHPEEMLTRDDKALLVGALCDRFEFEGGQRTLFDIFIRVAASLASVFGGTEQRLVIPVVG